MDHSKTRWTPYEADEWLTIRRCALELAWKTYVKASSRKPGSYEGDHDGLAKKKTDQRNQVKVSVLVVVVVDVGPLLLVKSRGSAS